MEKDEVVKMSQSFLPFLCVLRFCLFELPSVPSYVLGDSAYSLATRLLGRVDQAIAQIEEDI